MSAMLGEAAVALVADDRCGDIEKQQRRDHAQRASDRPE